METTEQDEKILRLFCTSCRHPWNFCRLKFFFGEGFSRILTHATFFPMRANYSSCFTSDNRFEWKKENWWRKMSPSALESLQSLLKSHHHDSLNGLRHSSLHLMGICACFSVLLLPHAWLWWSHVGKVSTNCLWKISLNLNRSQVMIFHFLSWLPSFFLASLFQFTLPPFSNIPFIFDANFPDFLVSVSLNDNFFRFFSP